MDNRKSLNIPPLDSIEVILTALQFLCYSTQKRNLAYLIQLRKLLMHIYNNYQIDRGLGTIFKYNLIRINCDIIESTLYCALTTKRINPHSKSKNYPKLEHYINTAKRNNMISKRTSIQAKRVNNFRNDLHPSRQIKLHTSISHDDYILSNEAANNIIIDLYHYFRKV